MPAAIAELGELRHEYYVVRHETSTANIAGTIVFDAGVHPSAKGQVRDSVRSSALSAVPRDELVVITSPRRRCLETTQGLIAELGLDPSRVEVHPALDERNFGPLLEGSPKVNYQRIYHADLFNPHHRTLGAESLQTVHNRVRGLVVDLEQRYPERRRVVLVTHADPGEILEASLRGFPPYLHRDRSVVKKLGNAEVRRLGGHAA